MPRLSRHCLDRFSEVRLGLGLIYLSVGNRKSGKGNGELDARRLRTVGGFVSLLLHGDKRRGKGDICGRE